MGTETIVLKKKASGAIGYMLLFLMAIVMVITAMYLLAVAKLMSHQHDIDDALTDSVLASLVCDDVEYFKTLESTGSGVLRYKNVDESYALYKECMSHAVNQTKNFYYDFVYTSFILYEVRGNDITITTFTPSGKLTTKGKVGGIKTPGGCVVTKTSAYAKVNFKIKSILDGSYIEKSRDNYCVLKIN